MVYYIGSLRKIRFNRNILYCKSKARQPYILYSPNLIGTFCIVNAKIDKDMIDFEKDLIGTFCIVN